MKRLEEWGMPVATKGHTGGREQVKAELCIHCSGAKGTRAETDLTYSVRALKKDDESVQCCGSKGCPRILQQRMQAKQIGQVEAWHKRFRTIHAAANITQKMRRTFIMEMMREGICRGGVRMVVHCQISSHTFRRCAALL